MTRRRRPLDLSHYFMTFIDDHSRKVWTFTLKMKDQVLDVFKMWYTAMEREIRRRLKVI